MVLGSLSLTVSFDMFTLVSGNADTCSVSLEWYQLPPRFSLCSRALTFKPCSTRFFTANSPVTPVPMTHTLFPGRPLPGPYASILTQSVCPSPFCRVGSSRKRTKCLWLLRASQGREIEERKKLEVAGAQNGAHRPLGIRSGVLPFPVRSAGY